MKNETTNAWFFFLVGTIRGLITCVCTCWCSVATKLPPRLVLGIPWFWYPWTGEIRRHWLTPKLCIIEVETGDLICLGACPSDQANKFSTLKLHVDHLSHWRKKLPAGGRGHMYSESNWADMASYVAICLTIQTCKVGSSARVVWAPPPLFLYIKKIDFFVFVSCPQHICII